MCFTFQRKNNDRCDPFVNFPLFFSWHYQITPIVFPMVFHSYGNWETYYFNSCVFPILQTKGPRVFYLFSNSFFFCVPIKRSFLCCFLCCFVIFCFIFAILSEFYFFLFLYFFILVIQGDPKNLEKFFFSIFWLLVYFLNSNYIFW